MADKQLRYKETQAMMPSVILKLVILMLLIIMGLFGYMYIAQEFLELQVGENALPASWALIILLATALLTYYVSRLNIVTKVDDHKLSMSLGVIGKRSFPLNKIHSVEPYIGNSAKDFLGYGYRIAIKQTGYVGRAKHAVLLKFVDEKQGLVITTNQPEGLMKALKPNSE